MFGRLLSIIAFSLTMNSAAMAVTIECAGTSDGALSLFDPGTVYDLVFTLNEGGTSATLHKPTHSSGNTVPVTISDSAISFQYDDNNYVMGIANGKRLTYNFTVDRYTGTGQARATSAVVAIKFVCGVLQQKAF